MKQFSTFIFVSHSFDPSSGRIELHYSLDDQLDFIETITIPESQSRIPNPASLLALHLIGGISYFKTCLPKKIIIRSGSLTEEQAKFWNTVYEKGLGEFFYRNNIDFRGLISFPKSESRSPNPEACPEPQRRIRIPKLVLSHSEGSKSPRPTSHVLVPLGGGKDSTVTLELLKKTNIDCTLLRIGRHPLIDATAKTAGLPLLSIERRLDPLLFKLNTEGALNGHIPITAYLSFLSIVIAEIFGFDGVAMSDERSANIGNVAFQGMEINHQWSKSIEFERLFRDYVKNSIHSNIEYFSLLRPLSELSIAEMFSKLPQYFSCTTSCNANWKILNKLPATRYPLPAPPSGQPISETSRWCHTCPKCAFVFALFAAFLPKETLLQIFGKNLFDEPALLPLYRELLGIEGFKPFECVGTPEETRAAFLLAHDRGDLDDSAAMQLFLSDIAPTIKDPEQLIKDARTPSQDHCVPQPFLNLVS